jgi:hypothetical protein
MENAKLTQNAEVTKHIKAAGKASGTMLAECRKAAELAAMQLDMKKPVPERIAEIMEIYAKDFAGFDANVRANFKDFLTIFAVPDAPVSIEIKSKDESSEIHTTAGDMASKPMVKHTMKDIAKQVREFAGMSRAAGGGRKPRQPVAKPAAAFPAAPDMTDETAFLAWCDNLQEYLLDAVYRPRIDARLIEMGLMITKTAKGKVVKGTASA